MRGRLRIVVFGAHPDDCESRCGGSAARWARSGHQVKFVSVTDGRSGHHEMTGDALVRRRTGEAKSAAEVLGIESEVLPFPDGTLEPTLEVRRAVIDVIRAFRPDLVLTHRPNDYHPDHRYTSQVVQDAAYTVAVPHIFPDTMHAALRYNPAMGYLSDRFQKPVPFDPMALVTIDDVFASKVEALHCHQSQVYEWLPWVDHRLAEVPSGDEKRREWLRRRIARRDGTLAETYRQQLLALYGEEKGAGIHYVETFELSEYGGELSQDGFVALFGHQPPQHMTAD